MDTIHLTTIRHHDGIMIACSPTGATTFYPGATSENDTMREHFDRGYGSEYWILRLVSATANTKTWTVLNRAAENERLRGLGLDPIDAP